MREIEKERLIRNMSKNDKIEPIIFAKNRRKVFKNHTRFGNEGMIEKGVKK